MKKFYNRTKELKLLENHYEISENNLVVDVMMGRRRIGKTELAKEYIKNKKSIYLYVTKKSSQITLNDFTHILRQRYKFVPKKISSWEDFFNLLFEITQKERLIVVFDEFQNFKQVDTSVFSVLQKKIDEYKNKSKMHLILIGSLQTMMERIFMEKEPLFGRVDNFIRLEGFNFAEIVKISRDHGLDDLKSIFDLYSAFNGIAKYYDVLEKFDLFTKPIKKILTETTVGKDTSLYKEGEYLLVEEFGRDYKRYFDILFCLSIGKVKTNEIAMEMSLPVTTISKYLSVLLFEYKLIEKRSVKSSRDNRYYIKDIFLRFWFSYVYRHYSLIEIGATESILNNFEVSFRKYQGFIFEELARNLFYKKNIKEELIPPLELSNYWDKKYEFDIYGRNRKNLIIGEIKMSSSAINQKLIKKIEDFAVFQKEKNIFKVLISFNPISNPSISRELRNKGYCVFDLRGLI